MRAASAAVLPPSSALRRPSYIASPNLEPTRHHAAREMNCVSPSRLVAVTTGRRRLQHRTRVTVLSI